MKNINKILSIKVKNVFSFKDEITISFKKNTKKEDQFGFYTFSNDKNKINISNIKGFYGANSSGKTNISIKVIDCICRMIKSKNISNIAKLIPFFNNSNKDSIFEISFITKGYHYTYSLSLFKNTVSYESLEVREDLFSNKKPKLVFSKKDSVITIGKKQWKVNSPLQTILGNEQTFQIILANISKSYLQSVELLDEHASNARNFFTKKIIIFDGSSPANTVLTSFSHLASDFEIKKKFNKIASEVKLGFDQINVTLEKKEVDSIQIEGKGDRIINFGKTTQLEQLPVIEAKRLNPETGELDIVKNLNKTLSTGTLQFIDSIVFVIYAMQENLVVFWEEFGTFMDFELTEAILMTIKQKDQNNSMQLIFNTNKKSIFQHLDWDQIVITKMNRYFESSIIKPTSEMQQMDFEKKYRNNFFGNLNNLNPIEIISVIKDKDSYGKLN